MPAARNPSGEELLAIIERELPVALAHDLPGRRWFGDKDRAIESVRIADAVALVHAGNTVGWALAEVRFIEGESASYALPLTLTAAGNPAAWIADLDGGWAIADGADDPVFADWWLSSLRAGNPIPTQHGHLLFQPERGLASVIEGALAAGGRLMDVEQSNSALRFGSLALAKLFRRIAPGINPDVEIGTALWGETSFRQIPEPLGVVVHVTADGDRTVSFVQRWTENQGDGWNWALAALDSWLGGGKGGSPASKRETTADIRLLGARTGEMHRALASCRGEAFQPALLSGSDCADLIAHANANLDATLLALDGASGLDERTSQLVQEVLARHDELRRRLDGMGSLAGTSAIRVHGDYHLGQVLRSTGEDWIILDFEGEPARPAEERRLRQPALKDVGGMLRSFAYARGAALDAVAHRGILLPPDTLAAWENDARTAFVAAYRSAMRIASTDRKDDADSPATIVPQADRDFEHALDAWELDKALYEVRYELANRPGWLSLPLQALARPGRI